MTTSLATTTFVFPPLKLKKADVKPLSFERMCFQFLVGKNNECTLVGHKLKAHRVCKPGKTIVVLQKDNTPGLPARQLSGRVLFVQLELSKEQLIKAIGESSAPLLYFIPIKRTVAGYRYIVYKVGRTVASGGEDIITSPCPPAIPPGNGGDSGD